MYRFERTHACTDARAHIISAKLSGFPLRHQDGDVTLLCVRKSGAVTRSTNTRSTLCIYYVQLFGTLHANNYVHLCAAPCVFSTIVPSCLIQGQCVARRYYQCQCYVTISRVAFQEAIMISTGSTKYQCIDGYFCDNVVLS